MVNSPVKYAPLSSGFMITSIIGFLVSIWLVMDWSLQWGFAFALLFVIMFISSLISMTKAEPIPEHMSSLAIHEPKRVISKTDHGPHYPHLKWYEPLFLIYFIAWIFIIFRFVARGEGSVAGWFYISFLAATVFLIVFFVSDVLSSEKLNWWQQLFFTVLIVFTAGLGVFIYYLYKRFKS